VPNKRQYIEAFVRGVAFADRDLPVEKVVAVLDHAVRGRRAIWPNAVAANRAFVKIAALAVAFWREVGEILDGRFELDDREEAILDAVVASLTEGVR
jgi:hypothetical protein